MKSISEYINIVCIEIDKSKIQSLFVECKGLKELPLMIGNMAMQLSMQDHQKEMALLNIEIEKGIKK